MRAELTVSARYLVVMDFHFKSVCRYFSSLRQDDLAGHALLVKIFPRLVMTIAKRPSSAFNPEMPVVELDCTVCKPISVDAFFRVCATRKFRCTTTYFGAEVEAPFFPPFATAEEWGNGESMLEERIASVSLQVPEEITGTASDRRMDWCGAHLGGKDLVFSAESDGGSWSRCEVRASLRALFRAIPPRRSGDGEPYYVEIRGLAVSDLEVIADVVSFV